MEEAFLYCHRQWFPRLNSMNTRQLIALVEDVHELDDGYAFRLPNDADTFLQVAQFIVSERQCCPFFNFTLELGAMNGPLWLQLTGQEGVKQFLQTELDFNAA